MKLLIAAALIGGIALQCPGVLAQTQSDGQTGPPGERGAAGRDNKGNNASIDPSENVKALNEQGLKRQDDIRALVEKRQDDIRALGDRLTDTQLKSIDRLSEVRYQHSLEMLKASSDRADDLAKMRAELGKEIQIAEKDRINAIRSTDVAAVTEQARRTSEQAATLQAQTTSIAEALRTQQSRLADDLRALVATTAATALANQQQQFSDVGKRLTTIEQSLSEGRGKQAFQDPAMTNLISAVDKLNQRQAASTGTDTGQTNVMFYLIALVTVLIAGAGVAVAYSKAHPPHYPYPPQNGYPPVSPHNGSVA
jgi:hypothetical protein